MSLPTSRSRPHSVRLRNSHPVLPCIDRKPPLFRGGFLHVYPVAVGQGCLGASLLLQSQEPQPPEVEILSGT